MRLALLISGLFYSTLAHTQARLVFNNDAYMVIDNSAIVVLGNSSSNAITQLGTGGRIVSESENDRIRWQVGTTTGTYTVPFSTSSGTEIPLSLNISTAGAGSGYINFSTYPGATWDNNTYRPSDVTHMHDYATGLLNNSNHVIDRFWIVDPVSYTTRPDATMSLTYIDAEHSAAGNSIVEGNLGAQRFNSTSGIWGDYLPQGTINTSTNVVSGIPVTPANFFRSWTLSETTSPLPIELLNFSCSCKNGQVLASWTTASESQVMEYTITGSSDGIHFEPVTSVQPTNLSGIHQYNVEVTDDFTYYTLNTVDMNGLQTTESVQTVHCGDLAEAQAWVQNDHVVIGIHLGTAGPVDITVFDAAGQLVRSTIYTAPQGSSKIDLDHLYLAKGIYFVSVNALSNQLHQTIKIFK